MAPIFDAFGVAARVTRPAPDDDPIETTVVWLEPSPDLNPVGSDFQRRDPIHILALNKDEVPTVPRGTQIVAVERDGTDEKTWKVDGPLQNDPDHHKVIVIQVDDAT